MEHAQDTMLSMRHDVISADKEYCFWYIRLIKLKKY